MDNIGLILEGGGMRGVYTAGVLDFFLDHGIYFNTCYAVSAGACHVCSYFSRQRGRALKTVVDFLDDSRYASISSWIKTGDYFGVEMIYDIIPNKLLPYDYDAFEKVGASFYAVVTNCRSGEAEYMQVKDMHRDMRAIQASSSLPWFSRMVTIEGQQYLDGGIIDSIPFNKSVADGHGKNVIILTQHRGYKKEPNNRMGLIKMRYRKYHRLIEAVRNRHERYNTTLQQINQAEKAGNAFVIQPKKPVMIDRLEKNKDKLYELYQEGYDDAQEATEKLKAFLS